MLFRLQWKEFQLARRKYPVQDIGPEMVGYRRVWALVRCYRVRLARAVGHTAWSAQRVRGMETCRHKGRRAVLYRGPTACPGAMPGISLPP